jgi:hypothetical protein
MHTSTYKGKRVHLKLKDGSVVVDKFLDEKSKHIILEDNGRILKSDINSFSINKNKTL